MEGIRERGLSPERVVKILAKHGTEVNLKEAGLIAGFMKKLVSVALNEFVRNRKTSNIVGSTYRKSG